MSVTYLNNAATSYPKPATVLRAVNVSLEAPPVEPGRVGDDDDPCRSCREGLAALLGVRDANHVVLLPSATYALNTAIMGLLGGGGHAVSTRLEHNSVLRPLAHCARDHSAKLTYIDPDESGLISPSEIDDALRGDTRLVVVTHASNVTGGVQPVEIIASACAAAGVPLLIDAAQSAGCIELAHSALPGRVFIAFAGHKGLLGPSGIGGLIVPDDELPQSVFGGTGVHSESQHHPPELPMRHEAGTPNLPGIAGLTAGVAYIKERGVDVEGGHRNKLVAILREALSQNENVSLLPLPHEDGRAGVVSFTVAGWAPEELGFILRKVFGVEIRPGLHCAPEAHRVLETAPLGAIRASVGPFSTEEDVNKLVQAIREVGPRCLV